TTKTSKFHDAKMTSRNEYCPLLKFMINVFNPKATKKTPSNLVIPTLPTECMQQIFKNIVDQGESLYPFLLVNRYWCKNVVPLLWSEPFENLLPENRFKIVCVYLSSLDEQERLELNSSLKPYDIHIPKKETPLFHYPVLLKKFSFKDLEMIVHSFVYSRSCDRCTAKDLDDQMTIITSSLCRLFLRNSSSLRSFKLDKFLSHSDIPECGRILDSSSWESSLSNISTLEIDYASTPIMKNSIHILKIIAKLCKQIRILDVKVQPYVDVNHEITEGIANIIRSQAGLKEFSLDGVDKEESSEIILALRTQAPTLTAIKFENVIMTTTSLLSLTHCANLKSLSILNCRGLTIDDNNDNFWNKIKFNLTKLYIANSPRNPRIPAQIINSSGGETLNELTFDVITPETVDATIKNCPKITNLTLLNYQPRQHNLLLNSLFQNLVHITHLTLHLSHKSKSFENMIIPGKSLPPNLEYLKLKCGFTTVQLDGLLNDCGENAKLKVLIIDFMKALHLDLKVILKFVKCRRTLRYLGIGGAAGWSGEEMKELEGLKEKFGVQVIPWHEVDKW
ncbi:10329_t:CDS:1, partial [Acaulospora morrowiae]